MADTDRIIAVLEQAKAKLAEARNQTFTVAGDLGKLRDQVQRALGRSGQNNPAIAKLRVAEQAIRDRAVEINTLSARIDKAIAQARNAAGGGGAEAGDAARRAG